MKTKVEKEKSGLDKESIGVFPQKSNYYTDVKNSPLKLAQITILPTIIMIPMTTMIKKSENSC